MNETMKCPACGATVPFGVFCEQCGQMLPNVPPVAPRESTPVMPTAPEPTPFAAIPPPPFAEPPHDPGTQPAPFPFAATQPHNPLTPPMTPPPGVAPIASPYAAAQPVPDVPQFAAQPNFTGSAMPMIPQPPSMPRPVTPPDPDSMIPSFDGPGGTVPVRLEKDNLCFMVGGSPGIVRFRIGAATGATVRNAVLRVESRMLNFAVEEPVYAEISGKYVHEIPLQIPSNPPPGIYALDLAVRCEIDGKPDAFVGKATLSVINAADALSHAQSLVFNISHQINAGHASDVQCSLDALKELENLRKSPDDPCRQLMAIADGADRAYAPVSLIRIAPTAVSFGTVTTPGTPVSRPVSRVTVGRHVSCDVVVRFAGDDTRSCRISRRHCAFERRGDGVWLRDGGESGDGWTSSSLGTAWNGAKINHDVRLNGDGTLTLAGEVSFAVRIMSNTIVLRRQDTGETIERRLV